MTRPIGRVPWYAPFVLFHRMKDRVLDRLGPCLTKLSTSNGKRNNLLIWLPHEWAVAISEDNVQEVEDLSVEYQTQMRRLLGANPSATQENE